jgi:hypothetical protein
LRLLKAIGASIGFSACFLALGCGSNVVEPLSAPSISAVLPQTIAAGSSSVMLKVVGANFTSNAVILWNGNKLTTTMVDATTLSGAIQGGSLAVPGTAQLQVQNGQTGQSSNLFPVSIVSSSTNVQLPLAISTNSIGSGVIGAAYAATLGATGGTAPYTWSITSGTLPAGLNLAAATGIISGTPAATGTFAFTVAVSDNSNPVQTQSANLSITIAPTPLAIATSALASGTNGVAYSQTLQAGGGTPAYSWSIASGSLPAGITLAPTGVISGTPTVNGTFNVTVAVSDSGIPAQTRSAALSITIAPTQLAIATAALASGTDGVTYSQTLQANGGTPAYTWSVTSGNLPKGLALTAGSGVISGTPSASGTFNFTVAVSDRSNPAQTKSASLSIAIASKQLLIASSTLASGTDGTAYSQTLQATGGTPSYTWAILSGNLPTGLALNAASGVISGMPAASGTYGFTVSVSDSSNPVQSKSATLSITIAATQLSITTSTLVSGTEGAAYAQTLKVTGGTPSYSWSVTSGSLPAGLTLATGSGIISGNPTASGTFPFTATVSDSSDPGQTKSASLSITIASTQLSITTATLASGTDGTAYLQTLQASGGTPSYSWSITSGGLPAGLTLTTGTGAISGTPSASGTFNFTVTLKDSSKPIQTKSANLSIVVAAAQVATGPGTTWYIRTDGGTRYSTNITNGQCNGKTDAAYPGTGVNQPCAFNDVRMLYQDGSYTTGTTFPSWGWVIAGGDTVIIRGSIGTGVAYRIGWNNNASTSPYCDANGLNCWGLTGDPFDSGMPPPPSGTASQHTRILGENYASCTNQSDRTQLHGGWGTGTVMSLNGASYVDVSCMDITDFSNCGRDADTVACESNGNVVSDFAGGGISLKNTSTYITLTDIRVHGLASDGMIGSPGNGFVATDLYILGNADAGWNADDGSGTTGVGSFNVTNFNISWNGCVEEYPIVDPLPYFSCTDDSSGGYGDGFGTATVPSPAPGWQVHFDQGIVSYNTQDGLDALHISGPGSTMTDTRVLAYGNQGQQLKVGGATATIQNSVIVGNCAAMTTQTIPGAPAGFGALLEDPCRAGNTAVLINVTPGDPAYFQDNTVYAGGAIGLEVEYATSNIGPANTLAYNNNVFMGFYNTTIGQNATPIYSNTDLNMLTNPGASWTNNSTFGQRNNWPCPAKGESAGLCTDPGLTDETYHLFGDGNMAPASAASAVVGAGVAEPAIPLDYTGQTRPNPPSIGAYEPLP